MNFKAVISLLLACLLLQLLLGSIVVESGSILSAFIRGAARDVAEAAGEDAIQAVASGVNDPSHHYQQPRYNGAGNPSTGGLTTQDLDYLQSVVKGILAYPLSYQQYFCGVGIYQNLNAPNCRFVTCCITDGRADARAIGQDCFMELIVQNILMYPTFYQQQYCVPGASSPDCVFITCTLKEYNRGNTPPKSIGQSCYLSSYTSTAQRSDASSITASVLVSVTFAVIGSLWLGAAG